MMLRTSLSQKGFPSRILRTAILLLLLANAPMICSAQEMKDQIIRGHEMLAQIRKDIRENYFDVKFRGVNLDERFSAADAQIDSALSGDQIYSIIAGALLD